MSEVDKNIKIYLVSVLLKTFSQYEHIFATLLEKENLIPLVCISKHVPPALCKKWPNTEIFLVCIFLYSVRTGENRD